MNREGRKDREFDAAKAALVGKRNARGRPDRRSMGFRRWVFPLGRDASGMEPNAVILMSHL